MGLNSVTILKIGLQAKLTKFRSMGITYFSGKQTFKLNHFACVLFRTQIRS